mmetsp:Transcript_35834/g.94152  ORF Transcript_35834/g.94152 Transcript_35834/m.94152 type:complete len:203 (+) Transcript_35834:155-763(+)
MSHHLGHRCAPRSTDTTIHFPSQAEAPALDYLRRGPCHPREVWATPWAQALTGTVLNGGVTQVRGQDSLAVEAVVCAWTRQYRASPKTALHNICACTYGLVCVGAPPFPTHPSDEMLCSPRCGHSASTRRRVRSLSRKCHRGWTRRSSMACWVSPRRLPPGCPQICRPRRSSGWICCRLHAKKAVRPTHPGVQRCRPRCLTC